MARSFQKTKIFGITTATSEKEDKRLANRSLRRAVKQVIKDEFEVLPELREVSNVWSMAKDGKMYWGNAPVEYLRK